MCYPQVYHNAINAVVNDPYSQDARDCVAKALRYFRKVEGRNVALDFYNCISILSCPIKLRDNGRWN